MTAIDIIVLWSPLLYTSPEVNANIQIHHTCRIIRWLFFQAIDCKKLNNCFANIHTMEIDALQTILYAKCRENGYKWSAYSMRMVWQKVFQINSILTISLSHTRKKTTLDDKNITQFDNVQSFIYPLKICFSFSSLFFYCRTSYLFLVGSSFSFRYAMQQRFSS